MKRALFLGGIAVSVAGGVFGCGELVGLAPPPPVVLVDGSVTDAPSTSAADASDGVAYDAAPACVFDLDAEPLVEIETASLASIQCVPAGVTPGATTILVQRGTDGLSGDLSCTSGLSLWIADDPTHSSIYQTQMITPPAEMDTSYEENVTIMADGLTLIALNRASSTSAADTTFLISSRAMVGTTEFGEVTAEPFGLIQAEAGTHQTLWAPVLSVDGLEFFYVVRNDTDANVNGVYEAVRDGTSDPFPAGTRVPALNQYGAEYVSGITADRKTLFLEVKSTWNNVVLTRDSISGPFVNPNAPDPPPFGAQRAKPFGPVGTCDQIIATCTVGGCVNEAICRTP